MDRFEALSYLNQLGGSTKLPGILAASKDKADFAGRAKRYLSRVSTLPEDYMSQGAHVDAVHEHYLGRLLQNIIR
jgi:hypothetical protein